MGAIKLTRHLIDVNEMRSATMATFLSLMRLLGACHAPLGFNAFSVGIFATFTQGRPKAGQPWAELFNAVGVSLARRHTEKVHDSL
jgi:hypothetical protein